MPGGDTSGFRVDSASDQQLLTAAQGGDARALGALLERYQDHIYRFGMKMCRHPDDAKDVLQDTLLAAARSIGDFRGGSSLSTWLYTIARSYCIKKRRRSKFAPAHEQSLEQDVVDATGGPADSAKTPDEATQSREVQRALDTAIRGLDPEQREVLLLRDVEGLPASEVGKVLGISVAAVKSRLHRARIRVRERMLPVLGMPEPAAAPAASSCPDVLTLYSKHLEGEISASLCAEMERHLEGCARCRSTCDSLKQTLSFCSRLPVAEVPTSVQDSVRTALRAFLNAPG